MKGKALVTGGAGFIGSKIAERLIDDGREVVVYDDMSTGHQHNVPKEAGFVKGSIDNYGLLRKNLKDVEVVYHFAASASVIVGVEQPVFDLENNVKGTVTLLNAMRDTGVKKILFPSSSTVYGENKIPMKEDMQLNPMSPYAVGKIADEFYLRSYYNLYGIEPVIFRVFNAFGPNQDLNNTKQGITGFVIGCIMQNRPFPLHGDGKQTRDYIYIDEVVEAFMLAEEEKRAVNNPMNLACNTQTSLNDWVELIEEVAGKKAKTQKGNPFRQGDVMHYRADVSKLGKVLGFKPKANFEGQLEETIEWAKEHLKKHK